MLPNGTSTLFGPASCRWHDVSGGSSLQHMSGLNNVLSLIQKGHPNLTTPYAAVGYGVDWANPECIRSYYNAYFNAAAVTEYMNVCHVKMSGCRQAIEWGYAKTTDVIRICEDQDNFK